MWKAGELFSVAAARSSLGPARLRRTEAFADHNRRIAVAAIAAPRRRRLAHGDNAKLVDAETLAEGHPFRAEPRIVLSPHNSGVTADGYVAMGVGAAKAVLARLAAEGLRAPVPS